MVIFPMCNDPCGSLTVSYTGISMVTDSVLEGTETFGLEVNATTLSPARSISGNLQSGPINITGMYECIYYVHSETLIL